MFNLLISDARGRYIPMKFIDGFAIDYKQDSTAGHGLFLDEMLGIEVVQKDDGTILGDGAAIIVLGKNDYSTHHTLEVYVRFTRQIKLMAK